MTKKIMRPLEPLEIALRAFVAPKTPGGLKARYVDQGPSEYSLIFDTETTVDTQKFRIGAYQFRKAEDIVEAGIFYDRASLNDAEILLMERYATKTGLKLISKAEFVDRVLFERAYLLRATIVGFNLPFDISRLAIRHNSARGKLMSGGFTFKLSEQKYWPNIQIRNLSRRAAFIQFAGRAGRFDTRGMRKKGKFVPVRRGYFVDLNTLSSSLLSRQFSLGSLAKFLGTSAQKFETDEHGAELTEEYVAYAVQDVQVTWECYVKLLEKFKDYGFTAKLPSQVLSEASIGKAYLDEMNIRPWREMQPEFPSKVIGEIMSAYYGGRSEVHIRRAVVQVAYCDFLSMYPTICSLMNLWKFVIAKGIKSKRSTSEVRKFVKSIKLNDLGDPKKWPMLATLVQVVPDADILPVRANYGESSQQTIGLNHLTSTQPLWFTLADVIASKLLTGKCPRILEAISFSPLDPQEILKPVEIAGNPDYRVDPYTDDFFKRLIELRNSVKAKAKTAGTIPADREKLENEQLALKIIANSTSYGGYIEFNVEQLKKAEKRSCFNFSGNPYAVETDKAENPGRFFHPLLGTLITGGARLMLAIVEKLAKDHGLDWAFCDTDSMTIVKTEGVEATFNSRVELIRKFFEPLNPYLGNSELFKLEDANFENGDKSGKLKPLYCLAISSKRYVLFNTGENGEIIIRKASAHGLGHLLFPYSEKDAPKSIPAPKFPLKSIGVERWQYDLWCKIMEAAINGHPDQVGLDYHPNLELPAASRYTATTPALLKWFDQYNETREYPDRIRPYNFLLAFQPWPTELMAKLNSAVANNSPKPIAPFDRDVRKAASKCFDRETGTLLPMHMLKSYRDVLAQFHLSPEWKFENGNYVDRGILGRRNIEATAYRNIGKEANRWEEQAYLGTDETAELNYGQSKCEISKLKREIRKSIRKFGERRIANRTGVSRAKLKSIMIGDGQGKELHALSLTFNKLNTEQSIRHKTIRAILTLAKKEMSKVGLSEFAQRLKTDPSNLAKAVGKTRPLPETLMATLLTYFGIT